eukprot:COSAG02_NODE_433_length_22435_cov_151.224078_19_plen_118_part_00
MYAPGAFGLGDWTPLHGGSPVMKAIFEDGKPMIFRYNINSNHWNVLIIVPAVRTIGFFDGLYGSNQFTKELREVINATISAAGGKPEDWSVLDDLGATRAGDLMQRDNTFLAGDVLN